MAGDVAPFPLIVERRWFGGPAAVELLQGLAFLGKACDRRRRDLGGSAGDGEGAEAARTAEAGRAVEAGAGGADRVGFAFAVRPGGHVEQARGFARVPVDRGGWVRDAVRPPGEGELRRDDRRRDGGAAPDAPARRHTRVFGRRGVYVHRGVRVADRRGLRDRAGGP